MYKTAKYELAVFFIAVKTNVGYSVVGEFVVDSENTDQMSESLSMLSSWNKTANLPFSSESIQRLRLEPFLQFFTCEIYLCNFHRDQSWDQWTKLMNESMASLLMTLKYCSVFCETLLMPHLQQLQTSLQIIIISIMLSSSRQQNMKAQQGSTCK